MVYTYLRSAATPDLFKSGLETNYFEKLHLRHVMRFSSRPFIKARCNGMCCVLAPYIHVIFITILILLIIIVMMQSFLTVLIITIWMQEILQ